MTRTVFVRLRRGGVGRALAGLLCLAASGGAAAAQTAHCQQLRGELASLGRGSSRAGAAANGMEAARLMGYYRQIGCERTGFFLFGGGPPAECGGIAARINALNAASGGSDGSEGRRRHLLAAINRNCAAEAPVRTAAREPREEGPSSRREAASDTGPGAGSRSSGARQTVCVRSCDGFFFPLSATPRDGTADEMCRALCPGAETAAYHMPGEDIGRAVSSRGRAYTQLANAFRFQKTLDASCSCKKPQESWAQVLQRAEKMLGRSASDVIVTARRSEELSRPKAIRAAAMGRGTSVAGAEGGDVSARAPRVTITFGGEAGQSTAEAETVPAVAAEAASRGVRVVSPDILPAPQTRTQ